MIKVDPYLEGVGIEEPKRAPLIIKSKNEERNLQPRYVLDYKDPGSNPNSGDG